MSRKNSLFILVLIFSFFLFSTSGYSWPFGNKKDKKTTTIAAPATPSKPASSSSSVAKTVSTKKIVASAVPVAVRSQDADDDEFEDEEEEEAPLIPELPQIPKIPNVRPLANISTGVSGIPDTTYKAPGQDPEIERIKKQIQDIIKINESLKSNYAGQAAEIQKISEQARIHQKLLKDLEVAKAQQESSRPSSEKYLNEEKIRLIKKETEKNQKFLDTLQTQDVSKGVQATIMPDQEARKS